MTHTRQALPLATHDAISVSIMWDRLVSIADEIVSALMRTSFSTIVAESYDLTVAILDANGQLLCQGTKSLPVFMGTAPVTLQHFLTRYPPETLKPGDVLISNDPWIGTGHLFDINVMRPVFVQQEIVGYTMSITHLPDIGGLGFGASATEIYHEGLRIPIVKLFDGGVRNELVVEFISNNVRTPDQVLGDLFANVTCNEVGERMLLEFMQEYKLNSLEALSRSIRHYSETAMRSAIRTMENGVYAHSIQIEGIDAPMTLSCVVKVSGDALAISFDGTDPCVRQGINVPFCYTNAMVLYAIKCLTVPALPNNAGTLAPVAVSAPPGCLLAAEHPSPTGARHVIGHFVAPLIFGALADAAPALVQADSGMADLVTFQGRHPNGRAVAALYFASGGFGALENHDGLAVTPGPSNMAVVPTELWEALTGTMIEYKRLVPDSGGPGAARGGLGQELAIRNDTGSLMTVFFMGNRTEFPPAGLVGGEPGQLRRHQVNGETVHPKGQYHLSPGDRITLVEAGGGGFGKPTERSRALIRHDIAEGYVTPAGATRAYGFDGE
jgi:N-methylhydantoinase B